MDDELFSAAYRISRELWPVLESRHQFPSRLIMLMSMWICAFLLQGRGGEANV